MKKIIGCTFKAQRTGSLLMFIELYKKVNRRIYYKMIFSDGTIRSAEEHIIRSWLAIGNIVEVFDEK